MPMKKLFFQPILTLKKFCMYILRIGTTTKLLFASHSTHNLVHLQLPSPTRCRPAPILIACYVVIFVSSVTVSRLHASSVHNDNILSIVVIKATQSQPKEILCCSMIVLLVVVVALITINITLEVCITRVFGQAPFNILILPLL